MICGLPICLFAVNDAVTLRLRGGILEQTGATMDVLQSDTMDHYRTFYMLERLLHSPPKLLNQLLFQIPPYRQTMLIERWVRQWGCRERVSEQIWGEIHRGRL